MLGDDIVFGVTLLLLKCYQDAVGKGKCRVTMGELVVALEKSNVLHREKFCLARALNFDVFARSHCEEKGTYK
jgi:hypothetical protein